MTTPYQPPGPNYGWFVGITFGASGWAHRLPTGALLAPPDPELTAAMCGAAASRWVAMDNYSDPEGVFAKCPTCLAMTNR